MRTVFLILFFASLLPATQAQDTIYEASDSILIENILDKYSGRKHCSTGDLILDIATEFTGQSYVGGTLDTHPGEPLVISTSRLDCTTFIELVLAISISIENEEKSFKSVCRNLEQMRYRNGVRNGYASRLHYISQWIADSAKRNIIEEVTNKKHSSPLLLDLYYMSSNAASYKQLKENPGLIKEIVKWEKPFRGKEARYIPKNEIYRTADELGIKNGDIIALTTNIKGLDVVHIGVAFCKDEKVHLLHASSTAGKVIKDGTTLFDYQKNRKSQTGIRVFRAK